MPSDYAAMTDEQIDLLIAERVYGGRVSAGAIWIRDGNCECVGGLLPSTPAGMLDLLRAMRFRKCWCQIVTPGSIDGGWSAQFFFEQSAYDGPRAMAYSPQRAVAIAALLALNAEAPC